jgi:hypothetical protein
MLFFTNSPQPEGFPFGLDSIKSAFAPEGKMNNPAHHIRMNTDVTAKIKRPA